ncbi:hypothetical protein ACFVT5_41200 [Streptomyces sp. NPDC058001]|uniref:hypothetical protein n=1 Tax=Streptomyces sp. NPDC058001 TaxID=3346300 RepID=UPI0036E480E2
MIARPPSTVPVPDAVALLAGAQIPPHILDAEIAAVDAVHRFGLSRGPRYEEARQVALADIARANKILAAHNPGLIVGSADLPGINR